MTPLRKTGPLKPMKKRGVSLALGVDLKDGKMVIRAPDGRIKRVDRDGQE